MTSKYLLWKSKDVKPREPAPPLTRKEKILNWLYYHKWWLIFGAFFLWAAISLTWDLLGIGRTDPDYTFAYVGEQVIPIEQIEAFENEIAALGTDVNGDGKVKVTLNCYVVDRESEEGIGLYYNYAANVMLVTDISTGMSEFYLTDDPDGLQRGYQIYAYPDGTLPEDGDDTAEGKVIAWSDSPALASASLDQALFGGLSVGRRYYIEEKQIKKHAGAWTLWETILEEADG